MPEGDTIFRAADTLHRALAGKTVTRFDSVFPALLRVHEDAPITGRVVESVGAAGKHLLMRFSGDLVLRTHLRMSGSWHLYRPGERWRRAAGDMRIVISTADFVAVAFLVHVAEFLEGRALERQRDLRALGPDLLGATFDMAEAVARLRARADATIESALLDQRALAGIGNVYKSEVLFVCGVYPFTLVAGLDDATLTRLAEAARRLMRRNVGAAGAGVAAQAGARLTTVRLDPEERLWVYGRTGRPCRRCGTAIQSAKSGPHVRGTYWCPVCQPPSSDLGRDRAAGHASVGSSRGVEDPSTGEAEP